MDITQIVEQLKTERDKLDLAISALESTNHRRKPGRKGRHMSAEARARISKAMKARWAAKRKKP